ncbi:helix-turn-helix domain-containing protein [Amycolatopsis alkalitolerans]|uniref:Helix-turn-helix domain-containing protein n=1 Tax=Amycolatopsis alkalitolerans TaxID=2547244 RepID=A0A5C4M1B6_9PSEU|nr:helix-turn-helix domain-containing protein [Amycolatopsis alkalitolerans]TNC24336.1 helix-turn-helix domain-containing protein [Amycolatopsis alkalitolerans]
MPSDLVPTADAAKAIGVDRRTLQRWVKEGRVKPTLTTAGGHHRWDVEDLKRQLREMKRR